MMQKQTIECYVCASCGKPFLSNWDHDEARCAEFIAEQRQRKQKFDDRVDLARREAVELAKKDEALAFLVKAGFLEVAREHAEDIYDDAGLPELGCSGLMESIYAAMIETAKGAV